MNTDEILALRVRLLALNLCTEEAVESLNNEVEAATSSYHADSVQRDAGLGVVVVAQSLHYNLDRYARLCTTAADDYAMAARRVDAGLSHLPNPNASVNMQDVPRVVGLIEAKREELTSAVDALVGALACPETPHPLRVAKRKAEEERLAAAKAEAERAREEKRAARAAKRTAR